MQKKTDTDLFSTRLRKRTFFLCLCFLIIIGLLIARIAYIKWHYGESFQSIVLNRMTNADRNIQPQRGSIVDRNNNMFATSTLSYKIILDPYALHRKRKDQQDSIYAILESYLDIPIEKIAEVVEKNTETKYALLTQNVPVSLAENLKKEDLSGVWFEESYIREYPKEDSLAQLIGFYNRNNVGQYGIEQQYDSFLTGKEGRMFSFLDNHQMLNTEFIPPTNGATVKLTIDEVIQEYTDLIMKKYVEQEKPKTAAAVFMNPDTGEIYSMYSYPSFNPYSYTNLSDQIGPDVWDALSGEKQSLLTTTAWKNHATQHSYEHGSTFKPLFLAKAIDDGVVSLDETFNCPGYSVVAGQTIRCWKRGGHGTQTLEESLANSCNITFIDISQRIEGDTFLKYLYSYGFGQATNINLPGESTGLILKTLGPVEKATYSIGQGFTATPLQLLMGFNTVINGGYLLKPFVVSEVFDAFGQSLYQDQPLVRKSIITQETSEKMKSFAEAVVLTGTARAGQIAGYRVGGKTGTAQKLPRSSNLHVLSFVGFAPVEKPEIIGIVLFDEVDQYKGTPVKAFREIMESVLPYMKVELTGDKYQTNEESSITPTLIDISIYEAEERLKKEQLKSFFYGVGTHIYKQFPAAGTPLPKESTVTLYTTTEHPDQLITVPDLLELTPEEASLIIGDDFYLQGGHAHTPIIYQVPKPGQKIEKANTRNKIVITTNQPNQEKTEEVHINNTP